MTWSPVTHSLNLNGPVPTIAPAPPWAYGILLTSVIVLSAPPALSAVGLEIPKTVRVWATRKLEFGLTRWMATVVGLIASTEATLDLAP